MKFDFLYDSIVKEMADITLNKKQVLANDKPLKTMKLMDIKENIVFIRQPTSNGFMAEGYSLIYFMDSTESAQKMGKGQLPYLMFPKGNIHSGGNPITDVWKKKYQKPGTEHIIGMIEANSMPDLIYVDFMSTRASYRRNRINSLMIDVMREKFPDAKIEFSSSTNNGRKFIKSYDHTHTNLNESVNILENHDISYPEAKGKDVMTFAGDINWKGKIIHISPQKFINLAAPLDERLVNSKSIENLKNRMVNQLPLDPLVLVVDMKTKEVVGHEGRHRARVAMDMGVKIVPVLMLTGSNYSRTPNWTPEQHKEVEDVDSFTPERR